MHVKELELCIFDALPLITWWLPLCRARGIDPDAARQVLVYSFGAEVTQHLKHKQLIERVQKVVASTLSKAPLLPVDST